MTETKFTPGPWGLDSTGSVVTADGGYVAEAYDGLRSTDNDPYIGAANARLIAAAPALATAIKPLSSSSPEIHAEFVAMLERDPDATVPLNMPVRCILAADAALLLANTGGTGNE